MMTKDESGELRWASDCMNGGMPHPFDVVERGKISIANDWFPVAEQIWSIWQGLA